MHNNLVILYQFRQELDEAIYSYYLTVYSPFSYTLYITTKIYPIIDIQNHRRTEATQRLPNFLQGLLIWGVEY